MGHLMIVKWLFELSDININISAKNDEAIKYACENGYIEIVKLIYEKREQVEKYTKTDIMIFFEMSLYNGNLDIAKWFWEITNEGDDIDVTEYINLFILENTFQHACEFDYILTAKWMKDNIPNVTKNIDITTIFNNVCKNGYVEISKWLYSIFNQINLQTSNDKIFKNTCVNGHLEIAKYLYDIYNEKNLKKLNTDRYTLLFKDVCAKGHLDMAKWLYELDNNIKINVFNDIAISSRFISCLISAFPQAHPCLLKSLFQALLIQ